MARVLAILGVSGLLAAVGANPASADSIVYVAPDGNVWLTTADGVTKRPVTADGTPSSPYRSPTQADDGTIVAARAEGRALHVFNRDGTRRQQWQIPGPTGSSGPLTAQVNPSDSGGLIVYAYSRSTFPSIGVPFFRVTFQDADAATADCAFPCYDGFHDPRYIPGTSNAGFVSTGGDEVHVQDPSQGSGRRLWLTADPGENARAFDVSRSGFRALLLNIRDDGSGGEIPTLERFDNGNVAPPDAGPGAGTVCKLVPFATAQTKPRWAPDSQSFTWHDAQGIWTSPAPVAGAGGACSISPRLVVPGGSQPDWGVANVPGTGTGPGPNPTPGPTPGRDTVKPVVSALAMSPIAFRAAPSGGSIAAAGFGTRVSYRLSEPARTTFTVKRPAPGRRVGRRCVAPRRSNRRRRKCTRFVAVPGSFARDGVIGANRFRFTGRLRGRKLRPGSYRLRATARDVAENVSRPASRSFRIVRR
jgi:hypothetical protein